MAERRATPPRSPRLETERRRRGCPVPGEAEAAAAAMALRQPPSSGATPTVPSGPASSISLKQINIFLMHEQAVQKRVQWVSTVKKNAIWAKTHERNARRVLNLMIELEGLWVKMGQYLSTRADVLPEPYINVLKQLQDSLPPRPFEEVRGTIEKELGKPMSDLFADFDLDPLATASIAQVHRATLADGREVVVKIQHDGVKEIILEDLKNAKSLIEWIAWAEPRYDFNPMIDEWCKEAPKELDFNHEAENTRTVSKNLSHKADSGSGSISSAVDVLIPEVIQSTEKVLVLEYMDGIRLNDNDSLEAYGVDKQKLVEEITRAYAHQIYIDGFFNGDPHPGNFLVSKEPPHKPILLDFGLTKRISKSMRQALAKMFLSCAEGDHVALLSAFAEMGLKLRVDMPQQAMDIATIFFRQSTTASEAKENIKALSDQRERNVKALQDKMKLNKKEVQRFNPVDAFPGDAIIFMRVLNLLRGLSASLNVRIVYLDIMRPFAESTLLGSLTHGLNSQWIYDSPANSDVESKLRDYLIELGSDKILGIQICAYKDGKVIIDTAAGMLGKYDPRPVQPDSLFPVFSVTKGITAGMVHWLVDKGKLKYEETVANIWPKFGTNRKELIKHASGKKFQEVLEEAIVRPLHIEGELYIGIPPGVESRLAALTVDTEELRKLSGIRAGPDVPPELLNNIAQMASGVPVLFNTLNVRRAIIPAANGHCSARALARYYAALARGGSVPPPHSASSKPPLGSHVHAPKFPTAPFKKKKGTEKKKGGSSTGNLQDASNTDKNGYSQLRTSDATEDEAGAGSASRIFSSDKILDAFMGVGEYQSMIHPNGKFGLGFRRYNNPSGKLRCFGHSGMGGSTGFCDAENDFAIAVMVNKMSLGSVTRGIIRFVCEELGLPVPDEYSATGEKGPDMLLNLAPPQQLR
ncbi:putative aarF domain-containing protein kinase 1 [Dichanthelium oligosanthes]|uniref:Putative aarF domain-containing protein kinase 1 n=1 Tax=Dichanthelium oligosanthes TaxID=888268 RepID=A0A1E5VKR5_9POAL|nr:putative aarF domain-containing protein kinase 1 [Dichanthelium oligosanthes]